MKTAIGLLVASLLVSSVAYADYVPPTSGDGEPEVGDEPAPKPGKRKFYVVEVEEEERPKRHVSITWDPLLLFYPVVELGVEVRAGDDFGVLVFGGGGKAGVDSVAPFYTGADKVAVIEGGAQFRYYATGDFENGMEVGVEALYMHADLSGASALASGSIGDLAAGLSLGPVLGWKLTTKAGFTLDTQIGVGFRATKQTTGDPNAPQDDRTAILLSKLAIGWSF